MGYQAVSGCKVGALQGLCEARRVKRGAPCASFAGLGDSARVAARAPVTEGPGRAEHAVVFKRGRFTFEGTFADGFFSGGCGRVRGLSVSRVSIFVGAISSAATRGWSEGRYAIDSSLCRTACVKGSCWSLRRSMTSRGLRSKALITVARLVRQRGCRGLAGGIGGLGLKGDGLACLGGFWPDSWLSALARRHLWCGSRRCGDRQVTRRVYG